MARKKRQTKATTTTDYVSSTNEAVASSSQPTRNERSSIIAATASNREDDHDDTVVFATTNTPTSWLDDVLPPTPGMEDLSTMRVVLVGAALLTFGTMGFHYIPGLIRKQHDVDDDDDDKSTNNNRWIDAFYCATITLTTIGFGDICPGAGGGSRYGRLFVVLFSFVGLGMLGGPVLQLGSSWKHTIMMIPKDDDNNNKNGGGGGERYLLLAVCLLGLGVSIFTTLEGLDHLDAIYASVIIGTTIGYGDVTPQTDRGKVAVALYSLVSIHVMAILLDPPRQYLERLCRRPQPTSSPGKMKPQCPLSQQQKVTKEKRSKQE